MFPKITQIHAYICSLALAGAAIAQPVYEIGYQFGDNPETVRTEAEPFIVEVDGDQLLSPERQNLTMAFPFATARRQGLAAVWGEIFRLHDPRAALDSRGRTSITFTDLFFNSDGSDPIAVGLVFSYGTSNVYSTGGDGIRGTQTLTEIEVELQGDTRRGTSALIYENPPLRPILERTGFLVDLPTDRHVVLEAFDVPVNTPVSLRIEVARSITVPAGEGSMSIQLVEPAESRPAPGLPIGRPVFILPDGVIVDSDQAGIRNNRFIICAADLDGDAQLTIFDFLAFQNLFDAGDLLADFDGDGELTIFDFLEFQNQFDAGCP
jgi:hypothetical protein